MHSALWYRTNPGPKTLAKTLAAAPCPSYKHAQLYLSDFWRISCGQAAVRPTNCAP